MNTQSTDERADEQLRALLASSDPEAGTTTEAPAHLLDRVMADAAREQPAELDGDHEVDHPSWLRRHWQPALLVAAAAAALALATPTVLPGLSGSDDSTATTASESIVAGGDAAIGAQSRDMATESDGGALMAPDAIAEESVGETAPGSVGNQDVVDESLVRSANLLVGTEDIEAERDTFVATILALGGRVTSETVITEGSDQPQPFADGAEFARSDIAMPYPSPWYPSGPGVWLSVQVPVDNYEKAVAAARATGEVVQMQQSSYDVGAQKADVDARIAALEASLARLTALMDSAKDVGDVIALEQAIASRQAQLDSLIAQQRNLANQTAMSQISLTLMSPEDATGTVEPAPEQTWWESFVEGLGQFWAWLGNALLIVSPLLVAGGIIWWVRRRQRRTADQDTRPASRAEPTGDALEQTGDDLG